MRAPTENWVAIDPSFKQYQFLEGLDPEQLAEDFVASGTVNEDESWVTGFDPQILQNAQEEMQSALEQFIEDNLADPTVGEVIGGRKAIVQNFPVVPAALPYAVRLAGARFAEVPEGLQQSITLAFGISHSGFPVDPITIPGQADSSHRHPWRGCSRVLYPRCSRPRRAQAYSIVRRALRPSEHRGGCALGQPQ